MNIARRLLTHTLRDHKLPRMFRNARWVIYSFATLLLGGCAWPGSGFTIIDHRADGGTGHYQEQFTEGYYAVDGAGNVDIVLRRHEPSQVAPREFVTQVLHIRSMWKPLPGWTTAEASQVNAVVAYAVLSGAEGGLFEGAGAAFFVADDGSDMTGKLERAWVKPVGTLRGSPPLFHRAELQGSFDAKHDPRQVARIVHDMQRMFAARTALAAPGG